MKYLVAVSGLDWLGSQRGLRGSELIEFLFGTRKEFLTQSTTHFYCPVLIPSDSFVIMVCKIWKFFPINILKSLILHCFCRHLSSHYNDISRSKYWKYGQICWWLCLTFYHLSFFHKPSSAKSLEQHSWTCANVPGTLNQTEMIRQFKLKRKKPFSLWIQWLIIEAWIWQLLQWGRDILNVVVRIEMLQHVSPWQGFTAGKWHKNNSRKKEELRASWLTDWWWIFIVIALSVLTSPLSGKCPVPAPGHGETWAWHLMMRSEHSWSLCEYFSENLF